uniref:Uncharacterized protein n=1 Tax=Arundo donax TaxID=35708 RepID=A0A0A9A903_ARUDO
MWYMRSSSHDTNS